MVWMGGMFSCPYQNFIACVESKRDQRRSRQQANSSEKRIHRDPCVSVLVPQFLQVTELLQFQWVLHFLTGELLVTWCLLFQRREGGSAKRCLKVKEDKC